MNGSVVELKNARKLWYWEGACAVEQLAKDGVKSPKNCKFTVTVDSIVIADMCQLIPVTEVSSSAIKGVKEWKK